MVSLILNFIPVVLALVSYIADDMIGVVFWGLMSVAYPLGDIRLDVEDMKNKYLVDKDKKVR